jgi:hypothetical protein
MFGGNQNEALRGLAEWVVAEFSHYRLSADS